MHISKAIHIQAATKIILILQLTILVLRYTNVQRIFRPRRDEVTGGWRKLHNEELHNLYSSPNVNRMIKSRRMRWAGYVARMGEKKIAYRILVGKPEGNRPLGRPRIRCVDNIKMDLRDLGFHKALGRS
jgi:hypothetical protein